MNSLVVEQVPDVFTEDEIAAVSSFPVPHHVAIIMDGNRRWAKRHHFPCMIGHWKGAETITHIVRAASKLGIKVLTVYAFSTENWMRSVEEVEALMHLVKVYLEKQRAFMVEEGVRLDTIGDLTKLPDDVKGALEESREATKGGRKIDLVLALNYGGRDDIRRACLAMIEDCEKGKLHKKNISEAVVSRYLDTSRWVDPQLLIRTSGEKRLSNFLLWQISYAEVYVTDVLWPDFTEKDLLKAVCEYQQRERRLGG